MKKLLTLVLAMIMVASLAACTPAAPAQPTPAPQQGGNAATDAPKDDATAEPAPAALDPMVVSMNVMNAEKNGNHARNELIKEKFNLTFDYIPVSWGDWNEKIRTWISTDDAPDLIWWDLKIASSTEYFDWASQGAFAPVKEELVAKYPNMKKSYDSMSSVAALKLDDVLYCWPSSRNNPPEIDNTYPSHFVYRRDWAQKVGLYKDSDTYTWDEWKELLRAVVAQDPAGNGAGNAALVMPPWGFPHAAVLFLNGPAAEGNETCSYIKGDDGKYVWPAATEAYKAGVVETYNMYQEGLIYKDNIQFTGAENDDMFKSGLAFATYNAMGNLNGWTDEMLRNNIITERTNVGPAIVSGMDGNWYMTQTEDYWTVTAFSHKVDDAKMDRIMMFWDYLMTDEGVRLRWLGIEGKDYEVTGDGLRDIKCLWPYDEATKSYVSPYANDEFNEANGAANGTPNNPIDPSYMREQQEGIVWKAMGEGKATIKKVDYEMSKLSAPNKDKYGTFGQEAKEALIKIIATSNADPAAEWDKFVEGMMPRVQPVLDEINAALAK